MNTEYPQIDLGCLLMHTATILTRQSDQVLQETLGIGFSQFKILRVLQQNPHIKQRVIADCLGQTEASVSRQVKLMMDDGLLRVRVSPKSRREHVTLLTKEGEELTKKGLAVLAEFHKPTYNAMTPAQREVLKSALEVIHGRICSVHDLPS